MDENFLSKGSSTWLIITVIGIPIVFFLLGLFAGKSSSPDNILSFLSTAAKSQAGVLAIVFSVIIIAIQPTLSKYSSRMVKLFTESKLFVYTFLIFAISIGVNLTLIYSVPQSPEKMFVAFVYMSAGLVISSTICLYVFIKTMFNRLTPEGILKAFERQNTPEKFYSEVEKITDSEEDISHPLYPLRSMFLNALSRNERSTAEQTLRKYSSISKNNLEAFVKQNKFSEENYEVSKELFKPILFNQSWEMAVHAEEHNESSLVKRISELQRELGLIGLKLEDDLIVRQACLGISTCIRKSHPERGDYLVNSSSWRNLGKFLKIATTPEMGDTNKVRPTAVQKILDKINSRMKEQLLRSDIKSGYLRGVFTGTSANLKSAQSSLFEVHGDVIENTNHDWGEVFNEGSNQNLDVLNMWEKWRKAMITLVSYSTRYFVEHGEYPITEGNFRGDLADMCISASNFTNNSYSVTLCQVLIETAFIITIVDEEEKWSWICAIARVKWKGDEEVVDKAFERILSHDYASNPPVMMSGEDMESDEYYLSVAGYPDFSPLNAVDAFPSKLQVLKEESDQRFENLREKYPED